MAEGDNYIYVNTKNGVASLSKGNAISEGDNYLSWETQHGDITHGTSSISEGDTILFVPTQHGLVAVKSGGCQNFGSLPIQTVASGYSVTFPVKLPGWVNISELTEIAIWVSPFPVGQAIVWGKWEIIDGNGTVWGTETYHGRYTLYDTIIATTPPIPVELVPGLYVKITDAGDNKIGIVGTSEGDEEGVGGNLGTTVFGMCEEAEV